MSTIKKISGSLALIAFALALPLAPAAAEEQVSTKLKEHTGLQPVSVKSPMPMRGGEASQHKVIEATLPTTTAKEPEASAENMPYITYEGAANSDQ